MTELELLEQISDLLVILCELNQSAIHLIQWCIGFNGAIWSVIVATFVWRRFLGR